MVVEFLLFFLLIPISLFLVKPFQRLFSGNKVNLQQLQKPSKDDGSRKSLQPVLPPGPRGLPLLGNYHQLFSHSLLGYLDRLASAHGPIASLRLGSIRAVVISSADVAREAFKGSSNDLALSSRPKLYATSTFFYGPRDIAFAPYSDAWRLARKACIAELFCQPRVQSFRGIREEEVAAVLGSVTNASSRSGAINFTELMFRMVNDVTCRVVFGRKFNGHGRKGRLTELLMETQSFLGGFGLSDCFPYLKWVEALTGWKRRVRRNFHELDRFYDEVIRTHQEEGGDKDDMVSQLLRLHQNGARGGAFDSMESIKGVLTDLFIAGTDTSTATLVWTMAELIRSPKVLERAQYEVRSFITKRNPTIDEAILPGLSYLKSVIKESLRLHPPSPLLVPRETIGTITMGNYIIPANTMVIINARAISRDQRYWESPDEFSPERFISKNKDVDFRGQHFELIPFGVGRRICPGINFSMASVELMLANLLCWFDWRLQTEECYQKMDMDEAPGITMHKKTPLWLVASKWTSGM